jgi:hypothetical protein
VIDVYQRGNADRYMTPGTISLYTIAQGVEYAQFASRWWSSVVAMDPLPDEVVIVIGKEDHAGIRDLVTDDVNTRIVELDEPFSNAYFRAGADAGSCTWIGFCGIDDQMLPQAYADIPEATRAGAEILVGTVLLSSGTIWRGSWNPLSLRQFNTLPAHSPVRRSLYERAGGFPDIHWSDWGFWLRCADLHPQVMNSSHPTAIFDVGEDRETMSGVSLDPQVRAAADAEILTMIRHS